MTVPYLQIDSATTQPWIKSTEETIAAVKAAPKGSLLIVDLDETLFLRNSSQAYLDCVYPRVLGFPFFLGIKALKPWRLLPAPFNQNSVVRDWFLIVAATLLFPWTPFVWRSRAVALATTHCNTPLAQAIDESAATFVIATRGFGWVVNPLIRHLPMSSIQNNAYDVIACRFWKGVIDRAKSKLEMVQDKFGVEAVTSSTVVTDSAVDRHLLAAAATPCLVEWTEASFIPAMSNFLAFIRRRPQSQSIHDSSLQK